jgi:shikimate dehydrogenase
MSPDWFFLGLIGFPLEHSLSPRLHQAALHACHLEGEYRLYPIPPGEERPIRLERLLDLLRRGEIQGLNVTIPLKVEVIAFLDDLSPAARNIGAVNTLYYEGNQLVGDNTDAAGFLADLERHFKPLAVSPSNALVLGAGGAARAVTCALLQSGWHVTVAARRIEQAHELIRALRESSNQRVSVDRPLGVEGGEVSALSLDSRSMRAYAEFSLIINATSVGMAPKNLESPWPAGLPFPRGAFVYDLVYNPTETVLVHQARHSGLQAINGLGMLVEQAALAFERWTKVAAPRHEMLMAVKEVGG